MDAMGLRDQRYPFTPLSVEDADNGVTVKVDLVPGSKEPFRILITGKSGRTTEFRFDEAGVETGSETLMISDGKSFSRTKLRIIK